METKRVLFCAESVYQLFNAITLRMTERADCACDLVLNSATNWNPDMLQRLEETRAFDLILHVRTKEIDNRFWKLELKKKQEAVLNPDLYFCDIEIPADYDELFVPIDHILWKLLYRKNVLNGKMTKVIMYDEGVRAYTMDLPNTDKKPYFIGDYLENRFIDAVESYYLHQPDLYSVPNYNYELKKIPNPANLPDVKSCLLHVYGHEQMPTEGYIYLEDFFFADRYITNDFELFKAVANMVGSENIITKLHPRDAYDRFTPLGYKTVSNSVVPWEIQLLGNDLNEKVLISVSSTSIITPFIIFESDIHVISLERIFIGENPTHKDAAFRTFFTKMIAKINQDAIHFHTPSSIEELWEVLRYIRIVHKCNADMNQFSLT